MVINFVDFFSHLEYFKQFQIIQWSTAILEDARMSRFQKFRDFTEILINSKWKWFFFDFLATTKHRIARKSRRQTYLTKNQF